MLNSENVRESGTVKSLPNGDEDVRFREQTAAFLISLIHMRVGLRVDPAQALLSLS